MANGASIAANVARLRLDRRLTQAQLAEKAKLSRVALGKIERGVVTPRARTIDALAKALAAPVGELVTPVRPLESVRFRAGARVHAREQILAEVSNWLSAYASLEDELGERRPVPVRAAVGRHPGPFGDRAGCARGGRPRQQSAGPRHLRVA